MGCWFFEKSITVNCITNVFILHQQPMCAAYNDGVCASQLAPTQILLEIDELSYVLKSDIPIQLVAVNKEHIAVSSGRQIVIYEIYKDNSLTTTMVTSFHCDTEKLLIYEHTLIVLTPVDIQLRSMEGTVMQMLLPTLPGEGEPITMDFTGQYLTVASLYGILKIWDLSKGKAKLHTRTMAIYEAINDFAEVIEAKCNSNCRLVSITVARTNLMPSSILYVWDIGSDQIHEFDFAESNDIDEDDTGLAVKCKGRLVTAHCWDVDNPRLLICRAERLDSRDSKHSTKQMNENDYDVSKVNVVLVSIFATSDHGIVVQDIKPVTNENSRLLGVQAPHIIK